MIGAAIAFILLISIVVGLNMAARDIPRDDDDVEWYL